MSHDFLPRATGGESATVRMGKKNTPYFLSFSSMGKLVHSITGRGVDSLTNCFKIVL